MSNDRNKTMSNDKRELIIKLSTEFDYDLKELTSKDYYELSLLYSAEQIKSSYTNDDLIDIM